MRKSIFLFAVLLFSVFTALALASCSSSDSDDNDSSKNPLVGTWYTDKTDHTEITYKADFTCTGQWYEGSKVKYTDKGKYKVDGNKLYIWWESEEEYGPWSTTFTISGNTMTTTEGGGTTWTRK